MQRSGAVRSGVGVSTGDGAAGSRLPALLALPHPQPFHDLCGVSNAELKGTRSENVPKRTRLATKKATKSTPLNAQRSPCVLDTLIAEARLAAPSGCRL